MGTARESEGLGYCVCVVYNSLAVYKWNATIQKEIRPNCESFDSLPLSNE